MVYVTSVDGTKIWAEATGNTSKPAVVFVPGFSYSSLVFDKQWGDAFMKTNYFMVRYDVRGQGISGQPLSPSAYGSQQYAQDFKAVIDYFGIGNKRPILAGWSRGGVTAADIATYYGINLIRGVVLLGAPAHMNMQGVVATPWSINFIPQLLSATLANFGPVATEFVEACVASQLDQKTKYSWVGAIVDQNPDVRLWSAPHDQNETALMNAAMTFPYLVLQGTSDKLVDGQKLKDWMTPRFGNLVFRLWDNTGHAPFWDNPDQTNREIDAFAKRLYPVRLGTSDTSSSDTDVPPDTGV